jgi:hypothetical protein
MTMANRWISREETARLSGRSGDSLNRWITYGKIRSRRGLRPPFRRVYAHRDVAGTRPAHGAQRSS